MCGIVGCAGNLFQRDAKIFRDMLIFDQTRGLDSTGVAVVFNGESTVPVVEKELGGPDNLWGWTDSNIFDERGVVSKSAHMLLGHNRWKTQGAITKDNAHPFVFDHITGVHNGSLTDWGDLPKDEDGNKFDVDSKALIKSISDNGIEETWKSFHGDASLVWWDDTESTLNFIRNERRPMVFAFNKTRDILYFASEDWMIDIACQRAKQDLHVFKVPYKTTTGEEKERSFSTFQTAPHTHIAYKVDRTSIKLVEERKLEKKPYQTTTNTYRGMGTGGTRNYGTESGYTKTFDAGWAKGLDKAGKELVGTTWKVSHDVTLYRDKTCKPYFVAYSEDGERTRLEIYFHTEAEFEIFRKENLNNKHRYSLRCRPRIVKNAYPTLSGFAVASSQLQKIAPASVVSLYPATVSKGFKSFDGLYVDAVEWHKNLRESRNGSCCAICGMGIFMSRHEEHKWGTDDVICYECVRDGTAERAVAIG